MILKRTYKKFYTKGIITMPDGQELYTLELPWRDNKIGKSCIPEGRYVVDRDRTGKQQWYRFRNEETAPRTHIEIHPANFLSHLQGCVAPCMSMNEENDMNPIAIDSESACELIKFWYADDSFVIWVTR